MRKMLAVCVIATVASLASPAHAQDYPNKLIKIVVPFTPGGSNDVVGAPSPIPRWRNRRRTATCC
jgi:tripartite-type tricarboxylate transporter receptor subunit TctC